MDFTIKKYTELLQTLKESNYQFQTFEQFISNPLNGKIVIMRHDVDRLPGNALQLAKIENTLGIKASYYFRILKNIWDETIARKIKDLGHEIGYHYEDVSLANGDLQKAMELFKQHLAIIQNMYPAKTICMHGSPLSRWDNRKLWEKYKYQEYGIIAEPYFDVDYTKVFYITDTGRAWNKTQVSVRDFVKSDFNFKIKSTKHLLNLIENDSLPNQIMINTHPHRWFNFGPSWIKEYILQNAKNVVKWLLIKWKNK